MKLIVFLLAVGLSTSEKLNRGYLPPPGAKLAGGSSGDLQTPLEFPKDNEIFESENNSNFGQAGTQGPESRNGISYDKVFSSVATGNFNDYTEATTYPSNSFETMTSLVPEMEYNDASPSFLNPLKVSQTQQDVILDSFGADGYHYGKPGNIPIIALSEGIMENYHPKAFGMYGGNPMVIKSYLDNMIVQHNGSHLNHPSRDQSSDEIYGPGSQKSDFFVSSSKPYFSSESKMYFSTTATPDKTVISSNPHQRSQATKSFQSRPKRPQSESDKNADILNYENVVTPDRYSYSFDSSNGIHMDESASTVDGVKALGSYSYTGDDGKVYSVVYSADENGFQPKGDHLPTPPPIPEAIQKVIEQAKREKEAGIINDGSYDEEKYGHMKYQGPVNRYLHNMKGNPQHKNRNRDSGPKEIYRKRVLVKANDYQVNGKKVQQVKKMFKNTVNNLNGQFEIRKDSSDDKTKVNSLKNQKEVNNINYRRPVTYLDEHDNLKLSDRPGIKKYDQQRKNTIKDEQVSNNNVANNFDLIGNIPYNNTNLYQTDEGMTMDLYKMTTPEDTGYYYVPPSYMFVEGRFQDKLPDLKEFAYQFGRTVENVGTESISESELYYIDQRENNGELPLTTTRYYTNTDNSDLNNFYESTIQDTNQPTNDLGITSTAPSNGITVTITTPKPHGNTVSTSFWDTDSTKDNEYQELIVYPKKGDDNAVPFTRNEQDASNLSTTQMPSEAKYSSFLDDLTTTNSANYPENEGYYRTKPDVPANFEDFPSSTNAPTFTNVGIQTKTIPNIRVDGFGRPIQDIQLFDTNAPKSYGYFTREMQLNEDSTFDKSKSPAMYYKLGDKSSYNKDDKLVSGDSVNLGLPKDETAKINVDSENLTDRIIGEDFSGPKQPQRYDPETGYFY